MISHLEIQQWTYNMWRQWAEANPDFSPFLTRAMRQWPTLFPEETLELADMVNPHIPQQSGIDWWDFEMEESQNEQTGELYLDPEEMLQMAKEVEERIALVLNFAALERLVEITTDPNTGQAEQMNLAQLLQAISKTSDPVQHFALHQGPVPLATQILWLIAWWIQDPQPTGLPTPPWIVALNDAQWPEPQWDLTNPPRPAWIMQFLRQWRNQHKQ